MDKQLVITIVAKDRPGIVQLVSEIVAAEGGNWMDSSMVRLGGEFAGIIQISAPQDRIAALQASLDALADQGMAVTVQDASATPPVQGKAAHLSLSGMDHPGIVRDISTALADCGASIAELQTELFSGSMTGQKMFTATARILVPPDNDITAIRDRLETLAEDIMVEIEIQPDA